MDNKARALFDDVFRTKLAAPDIQKWQPSLRKAVSYDEKFQEFTIDCSDISEEQRSQFAEGLNEAIQELTNTAEGTVFVRMLKNGSGRYGASIDRAAMETLQQVPVKERYRLENCIRSFARDHLNGALKNIAREALNIRMPSYEESRERWGLNMVMLREIERGGKPDVAMFLSGMTESMPASGYEILCDELDKTIENFKARMMTPGLLSPEQTMAALTAFGTGQPPLLMRLPLYDDRPDYYMPVIDLEVAQILQQAGLSLDLGTIVDRHYYAMEHHGSNTYFKTERDRAKALVACFNLKALINGKDELSIERDDNDMVRFNGSSGCSIDHKIGQAIEPEEPAKVRIDVSNLDEAQARDLAAQMNAVLNPALVQAGLAERDPVEFDGKEAWHMRLSMPYAPIDTLLRKKIRPSLREVFESALGLQDALNARGDAITQSLKDTLGYPVSMPIRFPDCFNGRGKYGQSFDLHFEKRVLTTAVDYPEPVNLFTHEVKEAQAILTAAGFDEEQVRAGGGAVRYAGGLTGHGFSITLHAHNLAEIEDLAQRMAPLKAALQPVMERAIAKSQPDAILGSKIFGYPDQKSLEHKHMMDLCYAGVLRRIDAMLQRPESKEYKVRYPGADDMGEYIGSLVTASRSDRADVRGAADAVLAELKTLAPALGRLITKAQPLLLSQPQQKPGTPQP